jgi:hypothetical protein
MNLLSLAFWGRYVLLQLVAEILLGGPVRPKFPNSSSPRSLDSLQCVQERQPAVNSGSAV